MEKDKEFVDNAACGSERVVKEYLLLLLLGPLVNHDSRIVAGREVIDQCRRKRKGC